MAKEEFGWDCGSSMGWLLLGLGCRYGCEHVRGPVRIKLTHLARRPEMSSKSRSNGHESPSSGGRGMRWRKSSGRSAVDTDSTDSCLRLNQHMREMSCLLCKRSTTATTRTALALGRPCGTATVPPRVRVRDRVGLGLGVEG